MEYFQLSYTKEELFFGLLKDEWLATRDERG